MPDLSSPGNGVAWPYDRFYQDAPLWMPSGVYGDPVTTPFLGDLAIALNGLNWEMKPGRAHVRGRGYERTSNNASGASATNSGTTPRIDRLVLRRDRVGDTCGPVLLQGTPASTPAKPGLQKVESGLWDLPLYSWTVQPNNVTTLANVTDERYWLGVDSVRATRFGLPFAGGAGVTWDNDPAWGLCQYWREQSGIVRVVGLIRNVVQINAAGPIATLPVGFRPIKAEPRIIETEFGRALIEFRADGVVYLSNIFASYPVPTPRYWIFDESFEVTNYTT